MRTGKQVGIGDAIEVRVESVEPARGRVDLVAAGDARDGGRPTAPIRTGAGPAMSEPKRGSDVATNRAARFSYEIVETFEAGIVLTGTEVKSLRDGKARLQDSYAAIEEGEVVLRGSYIPPYPPARDNHDPERPRKLLMHRWEIERLIGRMQRKGLTLIPTRIYFKGKRAKVELALARGKQQRDKRRQIRDRDVARDIEREVKHRNR